MKFKLLILLGIIAVAVLIRLWNLGGVPISPDWDEASLGYNAYSIMQTGRDEYGEFLPIILRSFDDYKPALYAYLVIPFIKIFGLNILSVRIPSAIFGVLAVILTYFLAKELFRGKRGEGIALSVAFLLAISPWHIQFSRIAFEAQVGLALNLLSLLFFLKGLKKYYYLLPSAFFASLSIYMYQSEKVYLPILLGVLILIYRREIFAVPKKWLLAAVGIGILLSFPMFYSLLTNEESLMRARGVSVFSDKTVFLKRNAAKIYEDKIENDYLGLILDNRRVEYVKSIAAGYISHLDLNWLFITGDIERHHAPSMGLLYLFELPFLLIGVYKLLFGDFSKKTKLTIFSILLIAPIPASVTSGVPHAVRAINMLPTFQIFVALGLVYSAVYISKIKYSLLGIRINNLIYFLSLFVFVFNFFYYLNQYFVQLNYFTSESWQYGYREAIEFIKPKIGNYKKIIVTNERPLDQSYIFFLYYLAYSPQDYQKEGENSSGGFRENHKFGKFEFRPITWDKEEKGKVLFIGRPDDFPKGIPRSKTIDYLDGEPAISIVE